MCGCGCDLAALGADDAEFSLIGPAQAPGAASGNANTGAVVDDLEMRAAVKSAFVHVSNAARPIDAGTAEKTCTGNCDGCQTLSHTVIEALIP